MSDLCFGYLKKLIVTALTRALKSGALLTGWLILLVCPYSHALAQADTVFFYNSESNIDNFATLKSQFDGYLSEQGDMAFQPYSERTTFEQALGTVPDGVYLLSGWHYNQLSNKLALQPVLVGSQKGALMQRKVLTSQDITDFDGLRGATLAGAGTEDYLRNLLRQMLGTEYEHLVDTVKLLAVPKDIDALMAVGFGIAKASIASESSLGKLAMINAAQHAKLKTLAASDKNFFLIAAITRKKESDEKKLLKTLEDMNARPEGEKTLKMLGLDGWKKVSDLDSSISKQLR